MDLIFGNHTSFQRYFMHIPTLETQRLIMRKITPKDTDDMYEYSKDPNVTRYLLWYPHADREYTKAYVKLLQRQYKRGEFFDWGLELKETGKMIGTCGITSVDYQNNSCEIGYVISEKFWNMGYATEAVKRVLRVCFDTFGFRRVEALHMEGNDASGAVMKKCGMKKEGTLRDAIFVKDEYRTVCVWSILLSEYCGMTHGEEQERKDKTENYV